jgi:hypothetical protein
VTAEVSTRLQVAGGHTANSEARVATWETAGTARSLAEPLPDPGESLGGSSTVSNLEMFHSADQLPGKDALYVER